MEVHTRWHTRWSVGGIHINCQSLKLFNACSGPTYGRLPSFHTFDSHLHEGIPEDLRDGIATRGRGVRAVGLHPPSAGSALPQDQGVVVDA